MRLAIVTITAMCVAAAGGQRLPQLMKGLSFKHSQLFGQLGGSPAIPHVHYKGILELRPDTLDVVTLMGDIALTLTAAGELTLTYDFADDDGGRYDKEEITIVLAEATDGKVAVFDHTGETEVGEGTLDDKRISLHFSRSEKLVLGYVGKDIWGSSIEVDKLELLLMKKENGNFDFSLEAPKSYHWGLGELRKTAP